MNGNSGNENAGIGRGLSTSSPYCVLWNNYHGTLVSTLDQLRREGQLLDCTIASTDGGRVQAHQLILAACSSICLDFIKTLGDKHPVILLPSEIGSTELRAMVEFMYTGQVCIEQDRLKAFIHGAKYLRIKGLEENSDEIDAEEADSSVHNDSSMNVHLSRDGLKLDSNNADASNANRKVNWEMVDRKPIILPQTGTQTAGNHKRRRLSSSRRRPMHISSSVVCYEQENGVQMAGTGDSNASKVHHICSSKEDLKDSSEPINKIRRLSTMVQGHYHDDLEICTCTSRKTWSVSDTEALLQSWRETLTQVPPSYFIRSMSLCKRVARNLQSRGIEKNWRQCQVKMKNLRREVRLYKESRVKISTRKPSEVANACEKLLPIIEQIFNKEEEIRQEWHQMKTDDRQRGDVELTNGQTDDLLAQVVALGPPLADSDLGEDTDVAVEADGGYEESDVIVGVDDMEVTDMAGVEVTTASTIGGFERRRQRDVPPHHIMEQQPDGSIHHIVEDMSLTFGKEDQQV